MAFDVPSSSWAWLAFATAIATIFVRNRRSRLRLPPGPKPLPLIGNVFDMPRVHVGREFSEMTDKHGDIVYLNVLGQSIVVLGSQEVARDLLDKRSAIYSDRPSSLMVELTGLSPLFAFLNYGQEWKRSRRHFHQCFNANILPEYAPVQSKAARGLLRGILKSTADVGVLAKFSLTTIVARVAYGIEINGTDDERYKMLERILHVGEEIAVPGRFAVEALPILRYLPSWLPGVEFRSFAKEAKRDVLYTTEKLYREGVEKMNSHAPKDFLVSRLLDQPSAHYSEEEMKKFVRDDAMMVYTGGADTTTTALCAFFLAMAMYPDVQQKAQAELDAVVGPDRLPELSDCNSLPYLNALIKELLRWHPVVIVGLPHRTLADDEYKGYFIPAKTIVIANIWRMTRDPERYPDPELFQPERFLDTQGKLDLSIGDPANLVFGFGRRVCPGRGFAEASLFILCASVLQAFNVHAPLDERGAPTKMEHSMNTETVISHPAVYDYIIKARSKYIEELILQEER